MKIFKFLSIAVSVKAVTTVLIYIYMYGFTVYTQQWSWQFPSIWLEKYCTHVNKYSQILLYGHPLNMDTSLLQTVCFVSGPKKSLTFWFFSKFNPLTTGIPLIWTLSMAISLSLLIGFECRLLFLAFNFSFLQLLVACQILILHSSLVALRW